MNWDHNEYTVAGHYLSALINDDSSGLTDEECDQVREFAAKVTKECGGPGHWSVETECSNFERCEICGLMGDCYDIAYIYQVKKKRGRKPSNIPRICKVHGEEMVEYKRTKGGRFFQCRECEAQKQLHMRYHSKSNDEIDDDVYRRLCELERFLKVIGEIKTEREENGSD